MQIANVKHSHCEAKFGFRVWETKFGRVRRKTSPAKKEGCCPLLGFYYKRICENLNFFILEILS